MGGQALERERETSVGANKEQRDPEQERRDRIRKAIADINRRYQVRTGDSDPIIYSPAEHPELVVTEFLPFGIYPLDQALGGGIPKKCISSLYGAPYSGKTTAAFYLMAQTQKGGGNILYFMTEGPYPEEAERLSGLKRDDSFYLLDVAEHAEIGLNSILDLIYDTSIGMPTGNFDLVVIDSIKGLLSKREADKVKDDGLEGVTTASLPVLTSWLTRNIVGRGVLRKGLAILCVNQTTTTIDSNPHLSGQQKQAGGNAMSFMPKVLIQLTRRDPKKDTKNNPIGHTVGFQVVKNNVVGSPAAGSYDVTYGYGVDQTEAAIEQGILTKSIVQPRKGKYEISMDGTTVEIAGIDGLRKWLRERPEVQRQLLEET